MTINAYEDGTPIVDTKHLQLTSLIAVMQEFGYWYNENVCNFYDPENENKIVSFKSAVELHNALDCIADYVHYEEVDGYSSFNHFYFSIYEFHRACAAQIVHKVKLQLNKKTKHIQTQEHKVCFVVLGYESLFLKV